MPHSQSDGTGSEKNSCRMEDNTETPKVRGKMPKELVCVRSGWREVKKREEKRRTD